MTRGYEAGNILAVEYKGDALPTENILENDLTRFVPLYGSLVEARDQVQSDEGRDSEDLGVEGDIEAKRYRWHRRAERTQSLTKKAKEIHGTRCQVKACGKLLGDRYGDLGESYIEAHHLTPFADLEGRPTKLDPKDDRSMVWRSVSPG